MVTVHSICVCVQDLFQHIAIEIKGCGRVETDVRALGWVPIVCIQSVRVDRNTNYSICGKCLFQTMIVAFVAHADAWFLCTWITFDRKCLSLLHLWIAYSVLSKYKYWFFVYNLKKKKQDKMNVRLKTLILTSITFTISEHSAEILVRDHHCFSIYCNELSSKDRYLDSLHSGRHDTSSLILAKAQDSVAQRANASLWLFEKFF